jgi:putative phosphoserine phosphatase/1-acylglycerol-3-phosphate O-acyltransferase
VRIRIGQPVEGLVGDPDQDTKKIMKAITALLPAEARKKRTPTADELARTYPGGKVKDTDETARRPGSD